MSRCYLRINTNNQTPNPRLQRMTPLLRLPPLKRIHPIHTTRRGIPIINNVLSVSSRRGSFPVSLCIKRDGLVIQVIA